MGVRILPEVAEVIFALLPIFTTQDRGGRPEKREMGSIQSIYAEKDKIQKYSAQRIWSKGYKYPTLS